MSFVAVGVGVAGAAAGLAGSMMQAGAAGDAAAAQIAAQREANASNEKIANQQLGFLKESRDQANLMQRPFAELGLGAQNKLGYLLGTSGGNYYQFNDKYSQGSTPKTYEWSDWVRDNKAKLAALQNQGKTAVPMAKSAMVYMKDKNGKIISSPAAPQFSNLPKPGTKEYAKAIRDIQLNLTQGNKYGEAAFQAWKKNRDEYYLKQPNAQPMAKSRKVPINKEYGSLLRDFSSNDFVADPGYQFRKEQGNRQLYAQLSAMGLTDSGRALKEGLRFSQGLADQTYNDAYNRYNQNRSLKYGFLSGQGSQGLNAATNISNNANQFGSNASNVLGNLQQLNNQNITGIGNSRSAGIIGQGNAWAGGLSSVGNAIGMMGGYKSGNSYNNLANQGYMA